MSYAVVAAVSAAASAVSTIQGASAQASAYRIQAQQAELQGRQNALNYSMQANQILERQLRLSATIRARAAAGGIDPMTGSPMTLDQFNAMKAGREMQISKENAELALAGGLAQSQALYAAADTTESMGLLKAFGQAGMAYGQYQQVKTPSGSTPTSTASAKPFEADFAFQQTGNIDYMGGGYGVRKNLLSSGYGARANLTEPTGFKFNGINWAGL